MESIVKLLYVGRTEADLAELEADIRRALGTEALLAAEPDFDSALARAGEFTPSAVILDLDLAPNDLLDAVRRAKTALRSTPIIALGRHALLNEALEAGASDYFRMTKKTVGPKSRRSLVHSIARALAENRLLDDFSRQADCLRSVFASAPIGLFALDAEGRFLMLEGRVFREIVPHPERLRDLNAFDAFAVKDEIIRSLKQAYAGEAHTVQVSAANGRAYDITCSPANDTLGGQACVAGFGMDVTSRRQLEEQLLHSQKMDAIGKLAGGVAHDFNNMMTVVNGYADRILKRLPETDPMREQVQEIRKAGGRASRLTHQLLAFGRKQILQPQVINVNSTIAGLRSMLERVLPEDVSITTLLYDVSRVKIDPVQFEQILMNLVMNARDAMPLGGRLTIEAKEAYLEDRATDPTQRRYVMVSVSDTGSGIQPEHLPRVFDPFFTTKPAGMGTGLGLSTVYGFVEQSGGHVVVESEVGQGSTFRIYLPPAGDTISLATLVKEQEAESDGALTILLVEDERNVRELTELELKDLGYNVLSAENAGEAILASDRHKGSIDLLLTDVVLPVMSGKRVYETLKIKRPDLRVLYMSGHTERHVVTHGVLEQSTCFMAKPFTP